MGQWIVGVISFQKMYGLYGLKSIYIGINAHVTDAGRQTTSEYRATQLLICEPLSLATGGAFVGGEELGLPPGGLGRQNRLDGRCHGGKAWGGQTHSQVLDQFHLLSSISSTFIHFLQCSSISYIARLSGSQIKS